MSRRKPADPKTRAANKDLIRRLRDAGVADPVPPEVVADAQDAVREALARKAAESGKDGAR